jgi:hypothetical protein
VNPLDRRYIAGMAYDRELPASFSQHDLLLAMGDAEEQRALQWLAMFRERQTTWPEVKAQIEEFLRERDAGVLHILDQIDRAAAVLLRSGYSSLAGPRSHGFRHYAIPGSRHMFTSIRKYQVRRSSAEELARRVQDGFVPLLRRMQGFRGYYLLDGGPDVLITISMFDSADAALASNVSAADWVRNNVLEFTRWLPEVMVGDVLIAEVKPESPSADPDPPGSPAPPSE